MLCHLSEAVAAPLSLPRRSEAKAGRGDSPKHGDSQRIREQAPRRGYSAIQYFNSLLINPAEQDMLGKTQLTIGVSLPHRRY